MKTLEANSINIGRICGEMVGMMSFINSVRLTRGSGTETRFHRVLNII